jgi:hypothetical protein
VFPTANESAGHNFPPTHHVAFTQPTILTEIFVIALSSSAYELARSSSGTIESWLAGSGHEEEGTAQSDLDGRMAARIVRQGDILTFTQPPTSSDGPANSHANGHINGGTHPLVDQVTQQPFEFQYQAIMTGPVLQGCAKLGHTRFFVAPGNQEDDSASLDASITTTGDIPQPIEDDGMGASDADSLEIDERFLASSVLSPSVPLASSLAVPRDSVSTSSSDVAKNDSNGDSVAPEASEVTDTFTLTFFTLNALPEPPLSAVAPSDITEDEDPYIFVKTADLSRTGIFSGDWVRCTFVSLNH